MSEVIFEKLGIKPDTPELYDVLGIIVPDNNPSKISPAEIHNYGAQLRSRLSPNIHPEEQKLINTAYNTLANPEHKALYDEHIYPSFYNKVFNEETAKSGLMASIRNHSFSNSTIALGATILTAASALIGISATRRISENKKNNEEITTGDRVQQLAGFAAAAAVIVTAVKMWKPGAGLGR